MGASEGRREFATGYRGGSQAQVQRESEWRQVEECQSVSWWRKWRSRELVFTRRSSRRYPLSSPETLLIPALCLEELRRLCHPFRSRVELAVSWSSASFSAGSRSHTDAFLLPDRHLFGSRRGVERAVGKCFGRLAKTGWSGRSEKQSGYTALRTLALTNVNRKCPFNNHER